VRIVLAAVGAILFLIVANLYMNTGFLQQSQIDSKDLDRLEYVDGVLKNAKGYTLQGSTTCWVMIHGYTSTPDELRIIAEAINNEFGDTVYVPRLLGHGQLSSDVEKYSVDQWYAQVEHVQAEKNCRFMLGSSLGASLSLGYAETHDVDGLVLVGALLKPKPSYLPTEFIAAAITPVVRYLKRDPPAQTVDDPVGRELHITTYSFPLKGAVELNEFNKAVKQDLHKINAKVLFLHSLNDTVADYHAAKAASKEINASFVDLQADHIVFRDYDKEKAVNSILSFRKQFD